jgi:N-methylhydantoinase A
MLKLAIDTGGTFTDLVLQDSATGQHWFWKTLSTPASPKEAVLQGLTGLAGEHAFSMRDVDLVLLATTVATNAVLERKGAHTALITTRGFRDVLILGRAKRYDTYNLLLDKPTPLVPRRRILEADERIAADGSVVAPLDESSVDDVIDTLKQWDIDAVAISLLHSYANPAHEQRIAERLLAWRPDLPVSISSSVSPKQREYERTSTTVINAYVTPLMRSFIDTLREAFEADGFAGELYIMQSNGGLLSTALARAYPVNIIESGPAAGVLLGAAIGRQTCRERILTFDMGGTTAKAGAVEHGEPAVTSTFEVGGINLKKWSGLPLNISAVELIEIGAGGNSIARADMGLIRVGPQSAGADPGPVCYAQGGTDATITDANVVLGYLVAGQFAGGRLALDAGAAEHAVGEQVAAPLGLSTLEAAWGIHAVANANMERALRSMSIERARDPRDYALVAFGGAGPLHAGRLARALGVREVIVPHGAGVGSAVGLLAAEPRFSVELTRIIDIEPDNLSVIRDIFHSLERRIRMELNSASPRWTRHAHLRYRGQGYELRIELPSEPVEEGFTQAIAERFHLAYRNAYGYEQRDEPVEATDWSLTETVTSTSVPIDTPPEVLDAIVLAPQDAYFPELGGVVQCDVHARQALMPNQPIEGPAIIAEAESTTIVLPGDTVVVGEAGHLLMQVMEESA